MDEYNDYDSIEPTNLPPKKYNKKSKEDKEKYCKKGHTNNPNRIGLKNFDKDRNGSTYNKKYTLEIVMAELDLLEDWLLGTKEVLNDKGEVIGEYDTNNTNITKFFAKRGYYRSWLQYICNTFPEFKERLEELKTIAESNLVDNALTGRYKENFTKFVLINHYKWADKTESKISTDIIWNETKTYDDDNNEETGT